MHLGFRNMHHAKKDKYPAISNKSMTIIDSIDLELDIIESNIKSKI